MGPGGADDACAGRSTNAGDKRSQRGDAHSPKSDETGLNRDESATRGPARAPRRGVPDAAAGVAAAGWGRLPEREGSFGPPRAEG